MPLTFQNRGPQIFTMPRSWTAGRYEWLCFVVNALRIGDKMDVFDVSQRNGDRQRTSIRRVIAFYSTSVHDNRKPLARPHRSDTSTFGRTSRRVRPVADARRLQARTAPFSVPSARLSKAVAPET
ncbi:hypothetical protein EVAR_43894_1 [Eumeta japonica]|uniref:Uncharacterized protein n=1 Tax=Eumeta variegata TaxID=151549 RepID=A0A4C1WNX0_EUMVA|nr:hypothetical protein EVAR_43894_1 [Eumeta japonica]